jgi:hypothetical protein
VALGALAAAGCGAHALGHAEHAPDMHDRGLLILATESDQLVTLDFCRDGDDSNCARVGPISPSDSLVVYALAPGSYCLREITWGYDWFGTSWHPRRPDCIDVAAGVVTYPGHLVLDGDGPHGWVRRGTAHAQFATAYPNLSALPVVLVEPHVAR